MGSHLGRRMIKILFYQLRPIDHRSFSKLVTKVIKVLLTEISLSYTLSALISLWCQMIKLTDVTAASRLGSLVHSCFLFSGGSSFLTITASRACLMPESRGQDVLWNFMSINGWSPLWTDCTWLYRNDLFLRNCSSTFFCVHRTFLQHLKSLPRKSLYTKQNNLPWTRVSSCEKLYVCHIWTKNQSVNKVSKPIKKKKYSKKSIILVRLYLKMSYQSMDCWVCWLVHVGACRVLFIVTPPASITAPKSGV